MTITIERNIPAPARPNRGTSDLPFAELQVGDSFVVEPRGASWAWIFSKVQDEQKRLGIKLTTRRLDDGRRRVWRTA